MKGKKKESIPLNKKSGNVDVRERLHRLNKKERHAVLATVTGQEPYTSLVSFALTPDARGLLFGTPKKTTKYKNILNNGNVSLLIDNRSNTDKGYMKSEAVTIVGHAQPVRKGRKRILLSGLYSSKHPRLEQFINAPSTALILVSIRKVIHAGNFQTVTEWEK